MRTIHVIAVLAVMTGSRDMVAASDWIEFANQTSSRLVASPALGSADIEEKDYAWGDVDNDGDVDLVVVRKTPFTSAGKRVNVLLINENGVLVDRTAEYASAADVPGDLGFLTPTNDRDVQLADLDLDGWLDMVTAVTLSDGDPKHIGHPRVYINLGQDPETGSWLGFIFQNDRIPTMLSEAGLEFNPRFCTVSVGDVTGDGYPDLFFGDYDSAGAEGLTQPEGADFNDRLLINRGILAPGFFLDETDERFNGTISGIPGAGPQPFEVSGFCAASAIADMNGDGHSDIVKQTSLTPPQYVGIAYNQAGDGVFETYEPTPCPGCAQGAPYHMSVGDLNNDNQMDVLTTDDNLDRYFLNQGNDSNGLADFLPLSFPSDTNGFGGNSLVVDLDNDGWNDVLVADVHVESPGCTRTSDILRNNGDGPNVTFTSDIANIPSSMLQGVHDFAVFDINGDGWKDVVIGRCNGTQVWMNQPPFNVGFSYPVGLPGMVTPNEPYELQVQLLPAGGAVAPGSATLHYSVAGGAFESETMSDQGGDLYVGMLPGSGCLTSTNFYFSAEIDGSGVTFNDPPGAPGTTYATTSASDMEVTMSDDIESDADGWTVINDPGLLAGGWEQADPNGTIESGNQAAPEDDATPDGVKAFVTGNGVPGEDAGVNDVDGGPTILVSPVFSAENTNADVSFMYWLYSTGSGTGIDLLSVEVSNNGLSWVTVADLAPTDSAWMPFSFSVGNYVMPTSTLMVRFSICDCPNGSFTEAGIDDFRVEQPSCGPGCPADLDGSGDVDAGDLAMLLGAWGPNPGHAADFDGNGIIGAADLALLLGNWGSCS